MAENVPFRRQKPKREVSFQVDISLPLTDIAYGRDVQVDLRLLLAAPLMAIRID